MKSISLLILVFLTFSCAEKVPDNQSQESIAQETPAALNDDDYSSNSSSGSSKWRGDYNDIIMKLYAEALENNPTLAKLDEAINAMPEMKRDSLKAYSDYANNNMNYYSVAKSYATKINDSLARQSAVDLFTNLENEYNASVSKYDTLQSTITRKQNELEDQLILMKLFVTKPMMENYQRNELPDIEALETVLLELTKLIKETENFSK